MSTISSRIRPFSSDTPFVPAPKADKGNDCQPNEVASRGAIDQQKHGRVQVGDRVIVTMIPEFPGVVESFIGVGARVAVVRVAKIPASMLFLDLGNKQGRFIRGTSIKVTIDRLRHDMSKKKPAP